MKPFKQMNLVEKAKLLSDLFPEEVPDMICFIEKQTVHFLENEAQIRSNWQSALITSEDWFGLVRDTEKRLKQRYRQLFVTQKWFSNQLFNGYKALFPIYCMVEYANSTECDHLLRKAIHLIFGEAGLILTKPEGDNK